MKLILGLVLLVGLFARAEMSLKEQLEKKAMSSSGKTPKEIKKVMDDALTEIRKSKIVDSAKKKGDPMPAFQLEDIKSGTVTSKGLMKKGPLLIAFYRGGWCPYCNLQLRDLQKNLDAIKSTGANLVAISPEAPDETAKTVKKSDLGFYVLSDAKGEVAKSFGLTFPLPKDLVGVYKKFGIELDKVNATKKWELPLSATYIVDSKGKIVYSFVDADYRKRAETSELVAILQKMKSSSSKK